MATQQFGLLDEREEAELHKQRLLAVEERPFKRLTKRLVAPGVFTNPNKKLPTPPPDTDAEASTTPTPDVTALKEDITLDFAAFDSAIARLQFLATANVAEREHYKATHERISNTMESVRESNAQLHIRLEEARATLAQRRKFDELADKITGNRMLRTRAEQDVNLAKLAEECEELKRESEAYGDTWRERRAQFEKLVDEGRRLRALIRDEKEEVERREGMDSDAEDGETAPTPGKGIASGNATPRPDVASSKGDGNATPNPNSGRDDRTPRPESPAPAAGAGEGLKPTAENSGSLSRAGSAAPNGGDGQQSEEKGEDIEMSEGATQGQQTQYGDTQMAEESRETPQITVDAPEDKMDTT
ncbi:Tho complex subunit 7-domain-containing protein [Xylariaceae sp. FL1272]|nr:Tho complex subunit 7-domain-containing protein [Xylariaceae sp. FL1272]